MRTIWVDEQEKTNLNERYDLAMGRIREIEQEPEVPACFVSYVRRTAAFILLLDDVKTKLENDYFEDHPEEWKIFNRAMYEDILPENYKESFGNPAYAASQLGETFGKLLCFLYAQVRGLIAYVFEGKAEETTVHAELFVQVCGILRLSRKEDAPEEMEDPEGCARSVRDALYWFESDYADVILHNRIRESIDPDCRFAADIVMDSDLSDLNYLYRYGEYITGSELLLAEYLNSLPQEEINRMADTWSEGYRMGFVYGRKPLEKKRTVSLHYHAGFERIVRRAVQNFEKMNLRPTICRSGVSALTNSGAYRTGLTGAVPNPQYDYDHREDAALMLDAKFSERRIGVAEASYEEMKELAAAHGGPAVMETFGEEPFEPAGTEEAWTYDGKQQKLHVKMRAKLSEIVNRYIIGKERSFTIIAFPLPDIAAENTAEKRINRERFEEIFHEIIRVNTLDAAKYLKIQEALIDALNRGTQARILGTNGNRTDLTVRFQTLKNPEKETIFENCGADVNIPVGEVFTTPVLKGTEGILHVSQVYLNGLNFRDLEIRFHDGMTESASCANFGTKEENDAYISDNILFHHASLPMGEFAIGTNTTAYSAAGKFGIGARLPILIAEKTGPHFAVGDTCYCWDEDLNLFNPDGKEIIAKDNEVSILRREDVTKAYFGCHTDITIPYEEIGLIEVTGENGYRAELIRDGRFILPGTEELNLALEQ